MTELDRFIKEINLVFTETLNRKDFCRIGFDINKEKINYENTISLYKLVYSFNKLYLNFKKEYEQLEKIDLGKYIKILKFQKRKDKTYRQLVIYIDEPNICNHGDTFLCLCEDNNKIYSIVTNNINPLDKKYYSEEISLDTNKVKQYLDLFEKYNLLLETYNYLKNQFVFGDGTYVLQTEITGDLIYELTSFKISYGSFFFNTSYNAELYFNLGETFNIEHDKCKLILDNQIKELKKETISNLLNNTYIHKSYLKKR